MSRAGLALFVAATSSSTLLAGSARAADELTIEEPSQSELGGRLGARLALAETMPGGVSVGAIFLYRMTARSWSETGLDLSFGGGEPGCFYTRASELTLECDHGVTDGFGVIASAGGRLYLGARPGFQSYARAGAGLAITHFAGDELTGFGLPLHVGAGGRFDVAPRVRVVAEALIQAGLSWQGRGLGVEPLLGLTVQVGVDFAL